ncbi:unnamed protein product [Umbelopsis sp. WA50703]
MDLRIGNNYRIGRKIGSGSFGEIYLGTNVNTGEEVAIKLESVKAKHRQLEYEAKVYRALNGGYGLPQMRWFGQECDYNALVMDLLGPQVFSANMSFELRRYLPLAQIIRRFVQLLSSQIFFKDSIDVGRPDERLEFIHSNHFIHRDIKPDNFLMNTGKKGYQVNIIDFGLAKKYRDPKSGLHIPYRENKSLTGTARYASINTHAGCEQSRRDDLISLGYVLLYLFRGSLPWQGLKATTKSQKYDRIMEKKITTSIKVLCHGLPSEFSAYMTYVMALRFDDKPDYKYLRKLFRDLFTRERYVWDYVFDWTVAKSNKVPRAQPVTKQSAADPNAYAPQVMRIGNNAVFTVIRQPSANNTAHTHMASSATTSNIAARTAIASRRRSTPVLTAAGYGRK